MRDGREISERVTAVTPVRSRSPSPYAVVIRAFLRVTTHTAERQSALR